MKLRPTGDSRARWTGEKLFRQIFSAEDLRDSSVGLAGDAPGAFYLKFKRGHGVPHRRNALVKRPIYITDARRVGKKIKTERN
jgi:hypothetical protein